MTKNAMKDPNPSFGLIAVILLGINFTKCTTKAIWPILIFYKLIWFSLDEVSTPNICLAYGHAMGYIYMYANDMRATLITLVSTVGGDLLPPWGGWNSPNTKVIFHRPRSTIFINLMQLKIHSCNVGMSVSLVIYLACARVDGFRS